MREPRTWRRIALDLAAFLGPFLALAAAGAARATARERGANAWDVFGPELAASAFADELARAWRVVLWAALPALAYLCLRRPTRAGVLWAAAWVAAFLPLVCGLQPDWRAARARSGFDVPLLFWDRPRLALWGVLALGCFAAAALGSAWLRRRAGSAEPARWPRRAGLGAGALALAVCALALARAGRPAVRGRGHSVVYVTFDSVRADHVSSYGYGRATTPRLDAFAEGAVLFERAYSQHNWTRPSYASILTSKAQWGRGTAGLGRAQWTLAEELKRAGYRTRALVQNPNISGFFGFDQGFDAFVEYRDDAGRIAERAVRELGALARAERPFFLFVHFNEPHWPYRHEIARASGFTAEDEPPISAEAADRLMRRAAGEPWNPAAPQSARVLAYLLAGYDAEIAAADAGFGQILDALDELGIAGDTAVLFNSDHGDEFQERASFGHGHENVYPELTRVPFVVRLPSALGVRAQRLAEPVQNLDLFPTVLGALELAPLARLEGQDLVPRMRGQAGGAAPLVHSFSSGRLAVRDARHALHFDFGTSAEQVFDLALDPAESAPLPSAAEPLRADLAAAARAWSEVQRETLRERAEPREPDADLTEELRRLGYL